MLAIFPGVENIVVQKYGCCNAVIIDSNVNL